MNKAQVYRNGPKHWAWEHHCPGRTHPATGFPFNNQGDAFYSAQLHMVAVHRAPMRVGDFIIRAWPT